MKLDADNKNPVDINRKDQLGGLITKKELLENLHQELNIVDIIKNKFNRLDELPTEGKVKVAGRVAFFRHMGKVTFLNLSNIDGFVQAMLKNEKLSNYNELVRKIRTGDIVKLSGILSYSDKGKLRIEVDSATLLVKSHKPPLKSWCELQDDNFRRRFRVVTLTSDEKARNTLKARSKLYKFIRGYMDNLGLEEYETPTLVNIAAGAAAHPFSTHYRAFGKDLFLRVAPELELKKILVGTSTGVYTICKCFRNEGISPNHAPEFTMLEFYIPFINYEEAQLVIIDFFKKCFKLICGSLKNDRFDFTNIRIVDYIDFLIECGLPGNILELSREELVALAKRNQVNIEGCINNISIIEKLYKHFCVKKIINPTLIINYPNKPLAKKLEGRAGFFQAFQLVVAGVEISNNYMEENDPELVEQQLTEGQKIAKGDEEYVRTDNNYIETLKYGMSPCAGFGVGIDRCLMLFLNIKHIRDTLIFPPQK